MNVYDDATIQCPYCGEYQSVGIDGSGGDQQYWQDCAVCCAPILFDLSVDAFDGSMRLEVKRDDDV